MWSSNLVWSVYGTFDPLIGFWFLLCWKAGVTAYLKLPAWSPKVCAAWANTLGRWKQVSTAVVLPVRQLSHSFRACVMGLSLELFLTRHSLKDAKFISVCRWTSQIFVLHWTNHTHTHTLPHPPQPPHTHSWRRCCKHLFISISIDEKSISQECLNEGSMAEHLQSHQGCKSHWKHKLPQMIPNPCWHMEKHLSIGVFVSNLLNPTPRLLWVKLVLEQFCIQIPLENNCLF